MFFAMVLKQHGQSHQSFRKNMAMTTWQLFVSGGCNKESRLLQPRAGLGWISGVQLYIDFVFTTGFLGLITLKNGKWYSDPGEVPDDVFPALVKDRSTMFLRVFLAFLKESGLNLPKKLTCPRSAAISFWTQNLPAAMETIKIGCDRHFLVFSQWYAAGQTG